MPDPSCAWDLHHSSWILNSLSEGSGIVPSTSLLLVGFVSTSSQWGTPQSSTIDNSSRLWLFKCPLTLWYLCNMEFYTAMRTNNLQVHATLWMHFTNLMSRERSQNTFWMILINKVQKIAKTNCGNFSALLALILHLPCSPCPLPYDCSSSH